MLCNYGRCQKARVADSVARVHAAPQRPLRIVTTAAIGGGRRVEVFYSTYADATAEEVSGQHPGEASMSHTAT